MSPPRSARRPAWAKVSRTGVFHADLGCPVLRSYTETPPNGYRYILELDQDAQVVWQWRHLPHRGWIKAADDPHFIERFDDPASFSYTPDLWRPCLRCGSLSTDGTYQPRNSAGSALVCRRCNLTICWCDD